MPKMQSCMSNALHTIEPDQLLTYAQELLRKHHCRNLPVVKNGKLVGLLGVREIEHASTLPGFAEKTVSSVMTGQPYTATPDQHLDQVMIQMAEHHYNCTVIAKPTGEVVGVFTTQDAYRVLIRLLQDDFG